MKFKSPIIFHLLLLFNISVIAQQEFTRETDSLALVVLYNSCDGPNWVNNENWLTGPLNTWSGISFRGNRVDRVVLRGKNENERQGLKNSIPATIGNLTELEWLILDNNELSGVVPSELCQLTKLTTLFLYENNLTNIPENIGNLVLLKYLDFNSN